MTAEDTYIKLIRRIRDWEWYTDGNTFRVFVHLLLGANWEPKKWRGRIIGRGQIPTGQRALAKDLCLSHRQIRTALDHLLDTGEITIQTGRNFSIITLVNYDILQGNNQQPPTHLEGAENPVTAGVLEVEDGDSDTPPTHHRHTLNTPTPTHQPTHLEGAENPVTAGVSGDGAEETDTPTDTPKKSADLAKATQPKEERIYKDIESAKSGKKKKTQEYGPDDRPYKACLWLIEQIKAIHPNAKVPDKDSAGFFKWCTTLRRMHERDGRSWEDFHRLVTFMRDDDRVNGTWNGWQSVLLSADGVREKWDKAWAQYEGTGRANGCDADWVKIMDAAATYGPYRRDEVSKALGERLFGIVEKIGLHKLCTANDMNQYKGEYVSAWRQG